MDFTSKVSREFTVLVLAGGRSSRMGSDKALLRIYPDGPTLIEHVVNIAQQAQPSEVLLVTNSPEAYRFLNLPTVLDAFEDSGPLGGIVGGMRAGSVELFVVIACDMPSLNAEFLRYIVSLASGFEAVVPSWTDGNGQERIEPLHAVYTLQALPILEGHLEAHDFALHRCLANLKVRYVVDSEINQFGAAASLFRNLNRPDEWESWVEGH